MKKILLSFLPLMVFANSISSIIVAGGMNVVIKPGKKQDSWLLSESPKADINSLNNSMLIKPRNFYLRGGHASAEVKLVAPLTYLEVRGDSNVVLDGAKTQDLVVVHSGNGHISLRGNIKLKKVSQDNSGTIRAIWVNSKDLYIDGSYGDIELAGRCESLKIMGRKDVTINGQYLRCKNTWVRSKDYSFIKVSPVNQFKVWATDNSKVYYYRIIDYLARDTLSLDNALVMHASN